MSAVRFLSIERKKSRTNHGQPFKSAGRDEHYMVMEGNHMLTLTPECWKSEQQELG